MSDMGWWCDGTRAARIVEEFESASASRGGVRPPVISPFDTAPVCANECRLQPMMTEGEVAVLDYGGQYCQLIVRRVRELGYVSHLYAPERLGELKKPGAIILSGGPRSTSEKDAPDVDYEKLKAFGVPVLGVCY